MAPVAGGIAYGQKKDRLVLFPGLIKSIFTPWIPVYRVPGMLDKIGALFVNQTV
jgi:hypothetical protein